MKNYVEIGDVSEGMVLGEPILGKKNNVVLNSGIKLTKDMIEKLKGLNVDEINVEESKDYELTRTFTVKKEDLTMVTPGMKLAEPVYLSQNILLFKKNTVLDINMIKQMMIWKIREVKIKEYQQAKTEMRTEEPDVDKEAIKNSVENISKYFAKVSEDINSGRQIDIKFLEDTVTDMIINVIMDSNTILELLKERNVAEDFLFSHSLKVCAVSLLIAIAMEHERESLIEIGQGALLHDIGILKLPAGFLNKPSAPSVKETQEYKNHPLYGVSILKNIKGINRNSLLIVLQHHEKEDGSGYPKGFKGDKTIEQAKIVGIADAYDLMTSSGRFGSNKSSFEALNEITGLANIAYNKRIAEIFSAQMGIYAVGNFVLLNDNSIGIVVGQGAGVPFRPVIKIIIDSGHKRVTNPPTVNLMEDDVLNISELVPPKRIKELLA